MDTPPGGPRRRNPGGEFGGRTLKIFCRSGGVRFLCSRRDFSRPRFVGPIPPTGPARQGRRARRFGQASAGGRRFRQIPADDARKDGLIVSPPGLNDRGDRRARLHQSQSSMAIRAGTADLGRANRSGSRRDQFDIQPIFTPSAALSLGKLLAGGHGPKARACPHAAGRPRPDPSRDPSVRTA